ncbi:hypothetical protein AB7C87_11725 [Natrarchaeobius sp. A-rgal3]|uniref:hypothetical protein n=1 Tax=Natrarchaeobius versutus TaxID=1679078 RepID=UPI00350E8FAA
MQRRNILKLLGGSAVSTGVLSTSVGAKEDSENADREGYYILVYDGKHGKVVDTPSGNLQFRNFDSPADRTKLESIAREYRTGDRTQVKQISPADYQQSVHTQDVTILGATTSGFDYNEIVSGNGWTHQVTANVSAHGSTFTLEDGQVTLFWDSDVIEEVDWGAQFRTRFQETVTTASVDVGVDISEDGAFGINIGKEVAVSDDVAEVTVFPDRSIITEDYDQEWASFTYNQEQISSDLGECIVRGEFESGAEFDYRDDPGAATQTQLLEFSENEYGTCIGADDFPVSPITPLPPWF